MQLDQKEFVQKIFDLVKQVENLIVCPWLVLPSRKCETIAFHLRVTGSLVSAEWRKAALVWHRERRNVPPTPGRHKTLLNTRKPFIVVAIRGQSTVIPLQSLEHVPHIGTVNARYFLNAYACA